MDEISLLHINNLITQQFIIHYKMKQNELNSRTGHHITNVRVVCIVQRHEKIRSEKSERGSRARQFQHSLPHRLSLIRKATFNHVYGVKKSRNKDISP